jgi:hypothetical protein
MYEHEGVLCVILLTNAAPPKPGFAGWKAAAVEGKSGESAEPVMNASPLEFVAMALAPSFPVPPRYVE